MEYIIINMTTNNITTTNNNYHQLYAVVTCALWPQLTKTEKTGIEIYRKQPLFTLQVFSERFFICETFC